ncbi:MAG: enoyl-CoA hydratase/isomerase family protein [Gammaproteobacteria bacterium]|nr:enoyl-CoA hydratase/isomerase family protein [Gammaproteobacteria bacterium]
MLDITDHGEVREIRLDRPPANAINPDLTEALNEALLAAADNSGAVVVSGRPGMFSAGLDVPELLQMEQERFGDFWQSFQTLLRNIALMPVPTVFALTGHAPAGGIVMAIFGDYRIMPRGDFKTGLNETQVGLVAPVVAYRTVARLTGPRVAERILVAGEMMSAERALEIGLVDELADEPEAVVARAIEWCEQHLALPRQAMLQTRAMARAELHQFFEEDTSDRAANFTGGWFSDETQRTLKGLVARLKK